MEIEVRPIAEVDRPAVAAILAERWGSDVIVAHGTVYQPRHLAGFLAYRGDDLAGIVTYHIIGDACEIVTINSLMEERGIGSALLEAVVGVAREVGCRRLWLVTTNDNLRALRFYQKRGLHLVALYPGAIEASRRIKPEIPLTGNDGIPIRDELELEMLL